MNKEYKELLLIQVSRKSGDVEYFAVDEKTAENMINSRDALSYTNFPIDYDIKELGKVLVQC